MEILSKEPLAFYKILGIFLIATATTGSQQDACRSQPTCHECVQTPSCAWCLDPSSDEPRCLMPGLTASNCRPEMQYSPNNRLSVTKSKQVQLYPRDSSVDPSNIKLTLRPKTNQETVVTYNYGWSSSNSTVVMFHNASTEVSLKFFTKCLNSTGDLVNTNTCDGLKTGTIIKFKLEFELLKCPNNPRDWQQTIDVYPLGLNTHLFVDLKMICSCDCESPGSLLYKEQAPQCSSHGTYKCGICECDSESFGRRCECLVDGGNQDFTCKSPNSNQTCSGKGQCICGYCKCELRSDPDEVISGKFCECDNFSCPRKNGLLCSGNGQCNCGRCACRPQWIGEDCSCSRSQDPCFRPESTETEPCSGNGVCQCGACKCKTSPEGSYTGQYCEIPPSFPGNTRHQRQEMQRCPPQSNYACKRTNGVLCSGHGTCLCGVCYCSAGWSREDCSCRQDETNCYDPRRPNQKCHGNGICECGTCRCNTTPAGTYSGRYCETPPARGPQIPGCQEAEINCYDPRNPRHKCHGHGNCECGTCRCTEPYSGRYCETLPPNPSQPPTSVDGRSCRELEGNCRDPRNPLNNCNSNGNCECGVCKCRMAETGPYSGRYCETPPTNPPVDARVCQEAEKKCYDPRDPRMACHGNGKCDCGICKCVTTVTGPYSGRYCETLPVVEPPPEIAVDEACQKAESYCYDPRNPRQKCHGNGMCDCGNCKCNTTTTGPYSGRYCETPPPNPPSTTERNCQHLDHHCYDVRNPRQKCHGNGICDCGTCKCNRTTTGSYSGRYCENSPPSITTRNPTDERVCQEAEHYCYDPTNPSRICNDNGHCECGRCECTPPHSGRYCKSIEMTLRPEIDETCQQAESYCYDPRNPRQKCHGNGLCDCGTCKCNTTTTGPFSGRYCEKSPPKAPIKSATICQDAERYCNDPRTPLKVCNANGVCDCGTCRCRVTATGPYSGRYCETSPVLQNIVDRDTCQESEHHCYDPRDPRVNCRGNGICDCGNCRCNTTRAGQYSGRYCENPPARITLPQPPDESSCQEADSNCYDPRDPRHKCNGIGKCLCGRCDCNTQFGEYSGTYCEYPPKRSLEQTRCTPPSSNYSCPSLRGVLCSGHGSCVCGTCTCVQGWSGNDCSCEETKRSCYDPRNPFQECHGNGQCQCGRCRCSTTAAGQFSGQYCEVPPVPAVSSETSCPPQSQFECPVVNGSRCSGHGDCLCGICYCKPGWSGDHCSCQESNCYDSRNPSKKCNDNGRCECGKCKCNATTAGSYFGQFCENPPQAGVDEGSGRSCQESENNCYDPRDPRRKCHGNGICDCGTCRCNTSPPVSYSGRYCEISATSKTSVHPAPVDVRRPNFNSCTSPTNHLECSGRGRCLNGTCQCERRGTEQERIFGNYCECDNFSCQRHKGLLCGGRDRGMCYCGRCVCNNDWTGEDCSCSKSTATCHNPNMGDKICSGHGTCDCGVCKCSEKYSGRFCEDCPTCGPNQANKLQPLEFHACYSQTTCYQCIQSSMCAWCLDPNLGTNYRCFPANESQRCQPEFAYNPESTVSVFTSPSSQNSQIYSNKSQINPQHMYVALRPGQRIKASLQYTHINVDPRASRSVELSDNAKTFMGVKFFSNCLNKNGPMVETKRCDYVNYGDTIQFEMEFDLTKCPDNPLEWISDVVIRPVHGRDKSIAVVEMLCQCACEDPGDPNYEERAPQCYGHGNYQCGICDCEKGYTGNSCEHHGTTTSNNYNDPECSGRGRRIDGRCQCQPSYSGQFCESCPSCQRDAKPPVNYPLATSPPLPPPPPFRNACEARKSCGACMQVPSCGWCSDPNMTSRFRCFLVTEENRCPPEFLLNPDNSMTIEEMESPPDSRPDNGKITPRNVNIQIRPRSPIRVPMEYVHSSTWRPTTSVELTHDAPDHVYVKFFSNCLNQNRVPTETSRCDNLRDGDVVRFLIEIQATYSCFEDVPDWSSIITIKAKDSRQYLDIDVDVVCSCRCEEADDPNYVEEAQQCNYHGTFMCGACNCDRGFTGDFCDHELPHLKNSLMLRYLPPKERHPHPKVQNPERPKQEAREQDQCATKSSCDECIQSSCAWCFDPNFISSSRCFPVSNWDSRCREEFIFNPDNALSITPANPTARPLLYSRGSATVTYQRLNLKLRTNNSYPFQLFYNNPNSAQVALAYSASNDVTVRFFSKCLDNNNLAETSKCPNSNRGQPIEFRVSVEVAKCPKDKKDWRQTVRIYPVDAYDNYLIDLELLCGCSCGPLCESKSQPEDTPCISPLNNLECSGRGRCLDGTCQCMTRSNPSETISGAFCECDNFSCEHHNGETCGGPGRGRCDCGRCVCSEGWTGNSCNCQQSNHTCSGPGSRDICSNHGTCECGSCICDQHYTGRYCEHCPVCSQQIKNDPRLTTRNSCDVKSTCDDCLQTPSCGWCYDMNQPMRSRCLQSSQQTLCNNNFFFNPNNTVTVTDVGPIAAIRADATQDSIFPARVRVKLRKNQPQELVMVLIKRPERWGWDIEMIHNASDAFSVKFFTSCLGSGGAEVETHRCSNVASKDMIEFKIVLELVRCKDRKMETIEVRPRTMDKKFIVDVEATCGCSYV